MVLREWLDTFFFGRDATSLEQIADHRRVFVCLGANVAEMSLGESRRVDGSSPMRFVVAVRYYMGVHAFASILNMVQSQLSPGPEEAVDPVKSG